VPKALSHTVVFTDDLDEALRLCTDVANLSPVARYEFAPEIAERLFGWAGTFDSVRAAFVGESPGALDLVEIPDELRGEVAPGMRLLAVVNRDAEAVARRAADAGFSVRGPLASTTMDGGSMALTEVIAGGLAFELVQFG
jgi:catechol 2,3-dioxygenase-like lactoylglutathione lyase family enzyme